MEVIEVNPPKRPGFLTVLCILTFIGSGWNVISNIFGMIMSPVRHFFDPSIFDQALSEADNPILEKFMEQAFDMAKLAMEHAFAMSLAKTLLYAASLIGAIMMFQLKKMGFYVYTVAQIILLFVTPFFLGFNLFVNMGIMFSSLFAILFIALYAVNLKKMN